jgi:hypothetical protein
MKTCQDLGSARGLSVAWMKPARRRGLFFARGKVLACWQRQRLARGCPGTNHGSFWRK